MKLKDILTNCNLKDIVGEKDRDIVGIAFDSRKATDGIMFFAVRGTKVDGHDYISKAVDGKCFETKYLFRSRWSHGSIRNAIRNRRP